MDLHIGSLKRDLQKWEVLCGVKCMKLLYREDQGMKQGNKSIKYGVYYHPKKGIVISEAANIWYEWVIEKNKNAIAIGSGSELFYDRLQGYEYVGEL